ncbi:MAG: phospholipase [Flavobacteriales bacterium]|nr:phospholipase [Flavobacteriales bacterium]
MEKKQFNLDYNIRVSNQGLEKSKVIFLLHGIGADKNDLFSFANYLPIDLTVIALQAPLALPYGGQAWYDIEIDNGKHVSDTSQAKKSVTEIENFIDLSVKEYDFDAGNIFVLGFSQGAILSYSLALNNPNKYKYFLPLSGFIMDEIMPNDFNEDYSNLDFYSAHGTMDGIIPIEKGRTASTLLKKLNIKHVYHEFPAAHSIAQKEFEEIIEWLRERL